MNNRTWPQGRGPREPFTYFTVLQQTTQFKVLKHIPLDILENKPIFSCKNNTNITVAEAIAANQVTLNADYVQVEQSINSVSNSGGVLVYVNQIFEDFADYFKYSGYVFDGVAYDKECTDKDKKNEYKDKINDLTNKLGNAKIE